MIGFPTRVASMSCLPISSSATTNATIPTPVWAEQRSGCRSNPREDQSGMAASPGGVALEIRNRSVGHQPGLHDPPPDRLLDPRPALPLLRDRPADGGGPG